MRLLLATGIFEPESGGPATYTPNLARELVLAGHQVTVLTYSDKPHFDSDEKYNFTLVRIVRGNRVSNIVRFFLAILQHGRGADIFYTLDWLAAGIPIAFAAFVLRVPYVVRLGGDHAWEHMYLGSGQTPVTLVDFYEQGIYAEGRYRWTQSAIAFVLSHARQVIFNSEVQCRLYERYWKLPKEKLSVIYNPVPRTKFADIVRGEPTTEIIFAGRLNAMKNVGTLVRAFSMAKLPAQYRLLIFGDGPTRSNIEALIRELDLSGRVTLEPGMRQREMLVRMKDARAVVTPSWTDISPNQVYEALAIGIPVLVTKENYLAIRDQLPSQIDPRSAADIAEKLEMLADENEYREFADACAKIDFTFDWPEVRARHEDIFRRYAKISS